MEEPDLSPYPWATLIPLDEDIPERFIPVEEWKSYLEMALEKMSDKNLTPKEKFVFKVIHYIINLEEALAQIDELIESIPENGSGWLSENGHELLFEVRGESPIRLVLNLPILMSSGIDRMNLEQKEKLDSTSLNMNKLVFESNPVTPVAMGLKGLYMFQGQSVHQMVDKSHTKIGELVKRIVQKVMEE